MRITRENIDFIPVSDREKRLLKALLDDIDDINELKIQPEIYITWIDEHTEYSPERVESCPDYYGMYSIRMEGRDDTVGVEMDIDTLDISLCLLCEYIEN